MTLDRIGGIIIVETSTRGNTMMTKDKFQRLKRERDSRHQEFELAISTIEGFYGENIRAELDEFGFWKIVTKVEA